MSRLIDADALKDNMFGYAPPEMTWDRGDIEHKIDEMPTIEAEPVRRGKWITDTAFGNDIMSNGQMVLCSVCGKGQITGSTNYCPNCGAKMEG